MVCQWTRSIRKVTLCEYLTTTSCCSSYRGLASQFLRRQAASESLPAIPESSNQFDGCGIDYLAYVCSTIRFMKRILLHYWPELLITLVIWAFIGWQLGVAALAITVILSILEITLSADNAVVNSRVLVKMS